MCMLGMKSLKMSQTVPSLVYLPLFPPTRESTPEVSNIQLEYKFDASTG